jgi:hypothetical protein
MSEICVQLDTCKKNDWELYFQGAYWWGKLYEYLSYGSSFQIPERESGSQLTMKNMEQKILNAEFEVLTAVVIISPVLWNITPSSLLEAN